MEQEVISGKYPEKTMELSDLDMSNFVDNESVIELGKEKIASLEHSISEIQAMITQREALRDAIVKDGDQVKAELNELISDVDSNDLARSGDIIKARSDLQQKKVEITQMQLNERVACWKDVSVLSKELREKQQELEERKGRMSMIDDLMKGGKN